MLGVRHTDFAGTQPVLRDPEINKPSLTRQYLADFTDYHGQNCSPPPNSYVEALSPQCYGTWDIGEVIWFI